MIEIANLNAINNKNEKLRKYKRPNRIKFRCYRKN